MQPLAKTPGAAQKRESGAERRRKGGERSGPAKAKGFGRGQNGVPQSSGLHLVAACDAYKRQLVSRRRILKYSMYTMIQALELRATAGRATAAGHLPENDRCFRLRKYRAPRTH